MIYKDQTCFKDCTKAELVWFNVVLYSCLCVIMQLDL